MFLISGNRTTECKYVYELPYTERKYLCNILDINDQWERLGGEEMGFSVLELNEIRRAERCGQSPTDRLLQFWGRKNNTILTLYFHLYSIEHFQAMTVLLPFIPSKYHYENLHNQMTTRRPSSDNKQEEAAAAAPHTTTTVAAATATTTAAAAAAAFPKPDSSLLVSLKHKNNNEVMIGQRNRNTASNSKFAVAPQQPLTQPQSLRDQNFCRALQPTALQPTAEGDRPLHQSKGNVPELLPPSGEKAVETQYPPARELGPSRPSYRDPNSSFTKILNTTLPPGASKYPTYSSTENNVEANNNHQPSKEPLKRYKKELKMQSGDAKDSVSQGGSGERENPVRPPQKDASRKRYQSNCSDISTLSECGVPMIPYEELEEATLFWNRGQLLGSGGFGAVYKGSWKRITVAVKRINARTHKNGAKDNLGSSHINQIMDELRFLQKYRLDYILQVYGFSADPGKPHCLVYQFMSNGSLEYRLQCRKIEILSENAPLPLTWRQRVVVALGTAAALQFLHTVQKTPLIHGDVKSANILLDDYLEPKLGDFGLAREGPQSGFTSVQVSHVHGTRPYIPDEYLRSNKLSTKVDTYSFGVVLFEICSGRRAYDDKTGKYLKDEVLEKKDPYVFKDKKAGVENMTVFDDLFDIGRDCINHNPKKRPDMTIVHEKLGRFRKFVKQEARQRTLPMDSQLGTPHPYGPTTPHHFPAFLPQASARPRVIPPLSPPWIHVPPLSPLTVTPTQPSLPTRPNPTPPPSHLHPPPPPREESVSPIPLPALSELLKYSLYESQNPSESASQSFSTEEEISCEMDDLRDSQEGASIEREPGPSQEAHANTVKVCIPLLSQLGIHQGEDHSEQFMENEDQRVVSAQGKKSFLD